MVITQTERRVLHGENVPAACDQEHANYEGRAILTGRCPWLVSAGALEFGATQAILTRWAYAGLHRYAADGPLPRLRAIATIMHPAWLALAARWETGIPDLAQIRERKLPVRVLGGTGDMFQPILAYYGLSRELIESWGGKFLPMLAVAPGRQYVVSPHVRAGEVDLILDNIYSAYTPEIAALVEAPVLLNLRFLALPDDPIHTLCAEYGGHPGFIPYRLVRGVEAPVPSVYRPSQLVFGRDDMPTDFAYLLAQAYDQQRDLFRQTHISVLLRLARSSPRSRNPAPSWRSAILPPAGLPRDLASPPKLVASPTEGPSTSGKRAATLEIGGERCPSDQFQPKLKSSPILSDRRNWGRWGSDDQIGAMNLITPHKWVRAASRGTRTACGMVAIPGTIALGRPGAMITSRSCSLHQHPPTGEAKPSRHGRWRWAGRKRSR